MDPDHPPLPAAEIPPDASHARLGAAIVACGVALGLLGILLDGRLDAAHLVPAAVIVVFAALTITKRRRRRK